MSQSLITYPLSTNDSRIDALDASAIDLASDVVPGEPLRYGGHVCTNINVEQLSAVLLSCVLVHPNGS